MKLFRIAVCSLALVVSASCSKNNPVSPDIQPAQGLLHFTLAAENDIASGTVTITKGSITQVLPITIADHAGSVTFSGIQVGTWNIQVQLYDGDGAEIYTGIGRAVVKKDQTTSVTIHVNQNTGTLVINVQVPEEEPVPPSVLLEEFDGTCAGNAYGITYEATTNGQGAVFKRVNESRIQYPYNQWMVTEGTLEWRIKVDGGYDYQDYQLSEGNTSALIFTTDIEHGDVFWPGSCWLHVNNSVGGIQFTIETTKYGNGPAQTVQIGGTKFKFGEWHSIGISFGSQGQAIMLDGEVVAANPANTQILGAGGTHTAPVDIPTIGESVSGFWANNRWEGGFEGVVDRFRISDKQMDWYVAKQK